MYFKTKVHDSEGSDQVRYVVKFTEDGKKRITNPELFYNIAIPQKFDMIPEKIRGSYISNKEILREKDIAFGYISFSKKKNI